MKDLLGKEPYCYKIHIINEKQCLPHFYRKLPYIVYGLLFLQENLYPPSFFLFFFKSQPTHK